ncbi:MAG TPA: ABC transporter ATP-binding protein [Dongiaceae bacterium]
MSGGQRDVVAVNGVTKRFGGITAVEDLSLAIAEKEFFALLGPSGCGKTTLLRVIAGFEQPDTGRVLLDGRDVTALRPNRRPVNMMFQSYALFPHLTVQGNVAYGLEMEGVAGPERSRRVGEALDLVQLGSVADRKPHQLSGGQRQRVALARALVKRPRVLLLDEPLAALDRKLRQQMQFELKRLQHEIGITFLVVTHDQEEALAMADRIALMDGGRIAQLDTPRGLYERPASRFVAGFIGMTNFLDGRLAPGGIEVDGVGLIRGAAPKSEGRATLAIRPERIQVSAAPGAAGAMNGTVVGIAYLGQDLVVQIGLPGRDQPLIARLGAGSEAARHLASGAKVWCDWPAEAAQILID